ncbi:MAG: DUF1566 domain-containing protein [Azoarcus sp.]|jgi:hypothetical protein|nr:DUF1566 domain-containing protein [Azoarcus sp.]
MKQHQPIRFSLFGVVAGMALAVMASAQAAPNAYTRYTYTPPAAYNPYTPAAVAAAPALVYTPPVCPVGTYTVPGGAYQGPIIANSSMAYAERFKFFVPDGDLCVYPYDGPFALAWTGVIALCDHGLVGAPGWRLPNERELYEIFSRGYNTLLGMVTGTTAIRYWSHTVSSSRPDYSMYLIEPMSGSNKGRPSIISVNNNINGILVANRCVKPAREFAVAVAPVCTGYACNNGSDAAAGSSQ